MALGNLGRVIAGQAMETAKKNVLDGLLSTDTPKPADKPQPEKPAAPEATGSVILAQIQGMQRVLREDQELLVFFTAGEEKLRVLEIFVPSVKVLVLAGVDSEQNVTRVITPADSTQLLCKIVKVAEGARPVRVSVLSPRPKPE